MCALKMCKFAKLNQMKTSINALRLLTVSITLRKRSKEQKLKKWFAKTHKIIKNLPPKSIKIYKSLILIHRSKKITLSSKTKIKTKYN